MATTPERSRPATTTARRPEQAARKPGPSEARRPGRRAGAFRGARRRVMIRKVDPWSVLKLSLIFYSCVLIVVMLALGVFWSLVNQMGLVDRLLDFLADLQLSVTINGGMIARAIFLVGLVNVVLWSGINVFLAFLYNLVADLVGGLKVTLADEDAAAI